MLKKVICGFQSGADQAGARAAKAAGLETGGWMPAYFKTEDGPRPDFADLYGARETHSSGYPERTRRNVEECDGIWMFAVDPDSRGTVLTAKLAMQHEKPFVVSRVYDEIPGPERPPAMARWIREHAIGVLMIAGNRESKAPGIGAWVERFLAAVFRILKESGDLA